MKKRSFSVALSAVSCALASVFMIVGQTVPFAFATAYLVRCHRAHAAARQRSAAGRVSGIRRHVAHLPALRGCASFTNICRSSPFSGCILLQIICRGGTAQPLGCVCRQGGVFTGVLCASWALFTATTVSSNELTEKLGGWIYLAIVAGGAVFFLLYDWLMLRCQRTVNAFVSKIDRGGRARRDPPRAENRAEDVFGEDLGLGTPDGESGENRENKKEESEKDGSNDGQ